MSDTVKISPKLAKDFEMNGLDATAEALILEPLTLRCAVIWYDAPTAAIDNEKGTTVPKVQIRRWEPLGHADDVSKAIRSEVEKAIEKRTGRRPIPWDITEITEEHRLSDTIPGTDE